MNYAVSFKTELLLCLFTCILGFKGSSHVACF